MAKIHIVRLSRDERTFLRELLKSPKLARHKRLHAQILLKADIGSYGPGWIDSQIAEAFDTSIRSVERVRERLCNKGLDAALDRSPGSGMRRKADGVQEAQLIALACGPAPEGFKRWTLKLLSDQFVQLEYIDSLCQESVRQILKKTK